jgi:hypothetical protein
MDFLMLQELQLMVGFNLKVRMQYLYRYFVELLIECIFLFF